MTRAQSLLLPIPSCFPLPSCSSCCSSVYTHLLFVAAEWVAASTDEWRRCTVTKHPALYKPHPRAKVTHTHSLTHAHTHAEQATLQHAHVHRERERERESVCVCVYVCVCVCVCLSLSHSLFPAVCVMQPRRWQGFQLVKVEGELLQVVENTCDIHWSEVLHLDSQTSSSPLPPLFLPSSVAK